MGQQIRFRRLGVLPFVNATAFGQKQILPISKGMLFRTMYLNWAGSLTVASAATNAVATLGRGDEWSALGKIEVIVNGSDTIRSFSGHELLEINRFLYGTLPRRSTTMGDATATAPTFDSTLAIPFAMPGTDFPMDTLLDSNKLSDMRLEVTLANPLEIFSTTGPSNISANLSVSSNESFGIEGQFTQWNIFPLRNVVSGANAEYQFQLPVSAAYRGFIINAAAGASAASADAPNSITNVKLKSGTNTLVDIPWRVLVDAMRQFRNHDRGYSQGTAPAITGAFNNGGRSSNRNEDAWAFLDLAMFGYLSEAIDALGFTELYLEFNVAAATTITVIPLQLYPVRGR
jgi:hypothetical protein